MSKPQTKRDFTHISHPGGCNNLCLLFSKQQLSLFQPVLTDEELSKLVPLFEQAVFDIKHFLKYTFALEKVQETKFELTKVGVTISEYTWNKIPFDDCDILVKFASDNGLQLFIVR